MTFKIKTKLDTSKWTHQLFKKKKKILKKKIFNKIFPKKIFKTKFQKKISKKNFQKKISSKKKYFRKKISAKKKNFFKIFFKKIEFVKLNFQMQQNICKNQIGTKKASFPRSPV